MRLSGGVEWALHCCVVLTSVVEPVPAARLAELHDVSPTYLAKQLQALARAGLVHSVQGKSGGYVLTRSPSSITLLDVVDAIDGPAPSFICTEIRRRGPLATPAEACTEPCPIARAMSTAESARRDALRAVTIADLAVQVDISSGEGTLDGVGTWLRTGNA
ncbi:RrF2 family transcriptional regulator [Sphaerisporangium aureirubrum]|uniref:RrF2 family transcriptional regulator n=1 Tax=Sphaerisporangium aureirubrum TaxID=1544736 RepID=A0ABW1NLE0_9ACTN